MALAKLLAARERGYTAGDPAECALAPPVGLITGYVADAEATRGRSVIRAVHDGCGALAPKLLEKRCDRLQQSERASRRSVGEGGCTFRPRQRGGRERRVRTRLLECEGDGCPVRIGCVESVGVR